MKEDITQVRQDFKQINKELQEMRDDIDKILLLLVGTQQEVQQEKEHNDRFKRRLDATIHQILFLLKL